MERRLLIAFALSFLIIVLSRPLWEQRKSPTGSGDLPTTPVSGAGPAPVQPSPTNTIAKASQGSEPRKAESEKLTTVETDLFRISFSNREAVVKSWILHKYSDSDGKPLDLIQAKQADLFGYPLALKIDKEDEISKRLSNALFVCDANGNVNLSSSGPAQQSLAFEFADQQLRVQKKMTFSRGSYAVGVNCLVWLNNRPSDYRLLWRSGFGDPSVDERMAVRRAIYRDEKKITRVKSTDVQADQDLSGSFRFVGMEDQYFAAVFLPALNEPMQRIHLGRDEHTKEDGKKEVLLKVGVSGATPDHASFRIFVGPKDTAVLQKAGDNLIDLIDYGWFAVVCKPLFFALQAIYSFCKNYGLAIILLTILINLALFPLRYKSIVSAQRMQKLQPQMKAIQERYKKLKPTDPKRQQMNAELMALYKQHGVNPLGGCLPLLLQMPFFIAFYNLLSVSIELRHAPFALWIKDLSAADHTFILPILMTVSMIAMQKMTPTPSADPVQAKMMLAMPLVFGFMLAFTSSGLVLYWLTSNLVGITQQYLMNRYGPTAAATSPAKQSKRK
jgi:YidC/Oxa1 family membrane protein insertase